jgi:hypothetical protein
MIYVAAAAVVYINSIGQHNIERRSQRSRHPEPRPFRTGYQRPRALTQRHSNYYLQASIAIPAYACPLQDYCSIIACAPYLLPPLLLLRGRVVSPVDSCAVLCLALPLLVACVDAPSNTHAAEFHMLWRRVM